MMRISLLLATSLTIASCQASEAPNTESHAQEIIGGVDAPFDNAVVAVFAGGLCTGTLVAPRVVLTAAHCVSDAIEAGLTNVGRVNFGDGRGPWIDSIDIVDMTMHRLYFPPVFIKNDIALVRLERDAPSSIDPLPISTFPLTEDDVGLQLRVVGFGNSDGANGGTGAGEKRQVTLPLLEVQRKHIGFGDQFSNTCQGDSGGPTFATFDGEEYVIGVTSFGASGCRGRSYMTRTDVMWDELLTEVISAWDGPCQHDGECVEDESCPFPDPDCDVCGMDGVCGEDCDRIDRDCPVAGLASDSCEAPTDCETRVCTSAPEDERVKYCSMSCDPSVSDSASGCFAPLTACVEQADGSGICAFPGITPRTQGATCEGGNDCRSGMCDANAGICVEECGEGFPECGEGFECLPAGSVDVCSVPGEDTDCSTGSSRSGALATLLIGLALAFSGRRRNSRRIT